MKRNEKGSVEIGDEWPENNLSPPAHNPVHSTGPFLDFSKFTPKNRGYTDIAHVIMSGDSSALRRLLENANDTAGLANLVMTGGARPLHMCGMSRGGDASGLIKVLIDNGAQVNAKDNYEMTAWDRLASNMVSGREELQAHGGVPGHMLPAGAPDWASSEFTYTGSGEVPNF